MDFIENIYVGENVDDLETVYYSLKRGIPVFNIYCICINNNSKNTFEIMSAKELFSKRNIKKDYIIVGIAMGKREALSLLTYIIEDAIKKGVNILNIKKALKEGEL